MPDSKLYRAQLIQERLEEITSSVSSRTIRFLCSAILVLNSGDCCAQRVDLTTLPNSQGSLFSHGFMGNGYGNLPVCEIGDIDGDGLSDFAVGMTSQFAGAGLPRGKVYVVYGSVPRHTTFDLSTLYTDNSAGFRITGSNVNSGLGTYVAPLGDVNGDGFDDFVISSYENVAFVMFGTAQRGTNFSTSDLSTSPSLGVAITGAGIATGVGDVNGDGYSDLIAGNVSAPAPDGTKKLCVIFGSGTPASVDLENFTGDGIGGFIIQYPSGFNYGLPPIGSAFCDFDGDGLHDVLIGGQAGQFINSGRVFSMIFPGKTSGFKNYILRGSGDEGEFGTLPAPADVIYFEYQPGVDWFQFSSSWGCAGDVNGDGKSDLFVGSSQVNEDSRSTAGIVAILPGRVAAPGPIAMDLTNSSTLGMRIIGASGDSLGFGIVALGDVNDDGKDDLMIRSSRPFPGTSNTKSLFLVHGREEDMATVDLAVPIPGDVLQIGPATSEWLPFNRAGDVDGDGFNDILVTSKKEAAYGTYIIYGNPAASMVEGWQSYERAVFGK